MRKAICLFLLTIFIIHKLEATRENGQLISNSGEPISGQMLYLSNGLFTESKKDGSFVFEVLTKGTYELKSEVRGQIIILALFNVSGNEGEISLGKITISNNIQLQEVIISDQYINRNMERMPEVKDQIIYAAKKNEVVRLSAATANLAQNNSRQLFAKVPGIQVWESDGSGVQMGIASRGLSPNRMWEFNTRQNGYDISADPFGYPEAYYTPSVESLDRIEIIRGAASLQFGPQFGGVVNYIKKRSISGKKISVESAQTFGSYGLFSTFNALGGQLGKFSYYASFNYRTSNSWRVNNDYSTWNGYLYLGYAVTKKLNIQLELTHMDQLVHQPGGLTDSMFTYNAQQSVRARNWFKLLWTIPAVTIDYKLNENHSFQLKTFGMQGQRNSVGFMNAIQQPDTPFAASGNLSRRQVDADTYKNYGSEFRYLFTYTVGKQKQQLSAGARYFNGNTARFRNNNGTRTKDYNMIEELPTRQRDLTYTTENIALFAEQLFRLSSRLSATVGARSEWLENKVDGFLGNIIQKRSSYRKFLLGGVGLEYKITANTNIYGNCTQAYRPVLFSDLTQDNALDSIDQRLTDSRGYNIDLGYRGTVGSYLSFDLSLFYLMYDNRVGTYLANGRNYRTNIGSSVSKGIEWYVEISPTAWFANSKKGKVSLFNTTSLMHASYVAWNNTDPSKSQKNNWVENAPQQIIRSGITYAFKSFSSTLQHSYISQAYADAMNTRLPNANATVGLIPEYHILDWSAQLKFKNRYTLNAGINNLGNQMFFTRRASGYPGPGLMPADGRLWYVGASIKM